MDKEQFLELGCPQESCTELEMQDNPNRVMGCTTQNFDGYIANIRPGGFATRITGLEHCMPGFYALIARGEIPAEVLYGDRLEEGSVTSAKRRKTLRSQAGQPPSPSASSVTSQSGDEATLTTAAQQALDFVDGASDAEAPVPGSPQQQIVYDPSSHSDAESQKTVSASKDSASETDASKARREKAKTSNAPSSDKDSAKSGVSGSSRRSIAILEPEVDAEFGDIAPDP
jgi:hypothetical protein